MYVNRSVSFCSIFILIFKKCFTLHRLAGSQAGAYSYVSEFHTHKLAPRAVAFATFQQNALHVFLSIPAILIVPMDVHWHIFNIDFKPWRLYIICISLVNLFNGIVFICMPESPKFLMITNRKEKALEVLRRVYAFNTDQPEDVNISII